MLQKIVLPRDDLLRDVGDCLLALMDRADQKFTAPDFVANIIFDLAALSVAGRDDILVKIANPQMWNLLVVEDDLIFAVHLFHCHIRQYIVLRRRGKHLAGTRIQPANVVGCLLYLVHADSHPTRNFRKASPAQIIHVFRNDLVLQAAFFSLSLELNKQTLAQIARPDSWRIKTLDQCQHFLEIFLGNSRVQRHFFRSALEKPVVINITDD